MTILCLASFHKGFDFLRCSAKREGARVLLLTSKTLEDAEWPRESIDEIFYMSNTDGGWNVEHTINAVSFLARREKIERVFALDDFDLEIAATLREHLRLPGLGETATRYFRDKLAMRMKAAEAGMREPEFSALVHDSDLAHFLTHTPGPWMLKPRSMAGAIGIKKIHHHEEVWRTADALGDLRSHYLVEQFVPGDVFHVDTLSCNGEVVFEIASSYGRPPIDVAQGGGVFTTRVLPRGSEIEQSLAGCNREILASFGQGSGASHSEFIRSHQNGHLYFLETSSRVGGANIAEMIEAATGINLWAEWARMELSAPNEPYRLPPKSQDYAALLVSLAREEWPDLSRFQAPEIVWRMHKRHHVGLVVKSSSFDRITSLLGELTQQVAADYTATMPAREKAFE